MNVFRIDEKGGLYLSSDIDDWSVIAEKSIDAVIDLDGGIDRGVPTEAGRLIYIYFPFHDEDVPDPVKLHAIAEFGAEMIANGRKVLCHCLMGYNRSALMAGLILYHLGMTGPEALELVRERRPGALFNPVFADYLANLGTAAHQHPDQNRHQVRADRSDRRA
jgi:protein-tyrosine phosphatase